MSYFTLSDCCLKEISDHVVYDLLFTFAIKSMPYKVVVDKKGEMLKKYKEIAEKDKQAVISTWLHLMTMSPGKFVGVEIDYDKIEGEYDLCLLVSSQVVNQKVLIVRSIQKVKGYKFPAPNIIKFNSIEINIIECEHALKQLSTPTVHYNIRDSIVATGGSEINDSKIGAKDEK